MSDLYYVELAAGGWLSFDRWGRIVALDTPGLDASFEAVRDALAQADANLERRKRDDSQGPHDGFETG